MTSAWQRAFQRIRADHRSGASALLADVLEAGRLFLVATRRLPPRRLAADLARFTRRLTASQPSMAPFFTLANALWFCVDEAPGALTWNRLHQALVGYADAVDRGLLGTIRNSARLVKRGSLVLTYSHSAVVRLALCCAMAAGRRFEEGGAAPPADLRRRLAALSTSRRLIACLLGRDTAHLDA